jgi:hypothetical protein
MPWTFNPFSGTFDQKGSGGGSAFFAGEVATYADLPLDGTAALNSRWLVRSASGVWPFPGYHQGGIYVRVSTAGVDRATDYLLADTNFPDVFSDAAFTVYDDADSTRSMQIEVTDNETLTFKVTGTDSVVRSVAFALSAIVLAALMASSAFAQNIGLVTDTNGNIVTRRTNELVWSNNLRFTPLTNANSRTAIIGTNGALTAGNVPSAAAANGALLTADGAGSSSFVASRTQIVVKTNATSRTNWATTNFFNADNNDPDLKVDLNANTLYRIEYGVRFTTGTNSVAYNFASTGGAITATNYAVRNGVFVNSVGTVGSILMGTNVTAAPNTVETMSSSVNAVGGYFVTRTGASNITLFFRWWPTVSNSVVTTLTTDSYFRVEKIDP